MKVNNVEITEKTIMATRQWYIDNYQGCIDEAVSGEVKVNDLPKYIDWNNKRAEDIKAGKSDHTLAFLQMALYIQTGECIAILS